MKILIRRTPLWHAVPNSPLWRTHNEWQWEVMCPHCWRLGKHTLWGDAINTASHHAASHHPQIGEDQT